MTIENGLRTEARTGARLVAPSPSDLRVDGRSPRAAGSDDRGVSLAIRSHPRLSWQVDEAHRMAYEVEVFDTTGSRVWSSGRVVSPDTSVSVVAALQPHQRYRWSVRIQATDGAWSQAIASEIETGPATLEEWSARWVSLPSRTRLRQPFTIDGTIDRARLYLTGQGLVRAEVNGIGANADHLDPTRTDAVRALYRCYDVGDLLTEGENTVDFIMGLGEWGRTGLEPRLLAELVVWHPDGSTSTFSPNESALIAPSRIVTDDPFYLERHDVAAEHTASWSALAASAFRAPADDNSVPAHPPVRVEVDPTPPARVVSRLRPVELNRSGDARLYDIGTNISGRSRVEIIGALTPGSLIHVVHGEHVGTNGRLDTTNLMMPFDNGRVRQVVEWVTSGEPGDVIEAWFAYHGFRYIEVQGLPEDAEVRVTAGVLHTDLTPSGRIRTDSESVELLLERAERTLLNNVHGVPEDCPTREQAAWTGDTASVAEYELAAFDTENFLAKWIRDLVTSQGENGGLPAIAPDVRSPRLPADPVWGAALHRLLLGHWLHYGDDELVHEVLPSLRRWADFQLSCRDDAGVIGRSPISYGHDWLALEQTPPPIHHTAATIDCLLTLARLELELGDEATAAQRIDEARGLRTAARSAFYDVERGVFANGSQGAYAAAIDAGILTGDEAEGAARRLEEDVRARGNRISGGFATTRTIVRALAATGRSQVVADMLEQKAEPGIGAMLASGPGTFWECWWIDPANTGTGSLDHVGLGGVFAGWVWDTLAGIAPTSARYRTFTIEPHFVTGLDTLSLETHTAAGTIRMEYRVEQHTATLDLDVPEGTVATLLAHDSAPRELAAGHHSMTIPAPRDRAVSPPPSERWSAPAIAPRAGDVTGPDDLLSAAIAQGTIHAGERSTVETLAGLNCMPIPHAQPGRAVAEIFPTEDGHRPAAVIDFPQPLDASTATFVYALVDLCGERSVRGARPTIRLVSADGSEISTTRNSWPAGWNRIAVDTAGWDGRSAISSIEISLLPPENDSKDLLMPQASEESPGGFHLGEVGLSSARRTW